jgi:Zn-dependent M28 family amino/carboxypeptidase
VTLEIAALRGTAYNVIAKPQGATACSTVSGGHYDSIPATTAADDNASGTAGVLELARVVAASGLAGAHCFVAFGAEEFGLFGSLAFVERLTAAEVTGVRAMLNLDVIGTIERLTLIGDDDMTELARIEAEEAGVPSVPGGVPEGSSSDHASFQEARIPVIFFYRPDNLIHTKEDAIGRIVPQSLEDTINVAYGVLEALGG